MSYEVLSGTVVCMLTERSKDFVVPESDGADDVVNETVKLGGSFALLTDGTLLHRTVVEGIKLPWMKFGKLLKMSNNDLVMEGKLVPVVEVRKVRYLSETKEVTKKEPKMNREEAVQKAKELPRETVPFHLLPVLSKAEMCDIINFVGKRDYFLSRKGFLCQRKFDEQDEQFVVTVARPNTRHEATTNVGQVFLKAFYKNKPAQLKALGLI